MSKLERYREEAIKHLELCEARYKDKEWTRIPLDYARRWAQAFDSPEVNLNALANIVREAEREPGQYDIGFHAYINDMRRIYHELWEESLHRQNDK